MVLGLLGKWEMGTGHRLGNTGGQRGEPEDEQKVRAFARVVIVSILGKASVLKADEAGVDTCLRS
jgi:hypothetical protein